MSQLNDQLETLNQPNSDTESVNLRKHKDMKKQTFVQPTPAFVGASWTALLLGAGAYLIGLWNAAMQLNEKGYYFTLLLFGLFSAISLQKSVRDKLEGLKVTAIYYAVSWFAFVAALVLLAVGLFNASLALSEKGFYAMAYALSLFAAIAVQKNTRDMSYFDDEESAQFSNTESE
ncbi:hypothetical protein GCM10007414_21260 [Agarivorans gilvus]|uniref:YiaAB two helix domain-containing protein n=2 Tax=Agarivorans gilvus TaxID=680279 RepID=A0ABQ1I1J7_9ALTE|nr:hypothetical protein GCM10007414_21260 [Agarivorans gilvus]